MDPMGLVTSLVEKLWEDKGFPLKCTTESGVPCCETSADTVFTKPTLLKPCPHLPVAQDNKTNNSIGIKQSKDRIFFSPNPFFSKINCASIHIISSHLISQSPSPTFGSSHITLLMCHSHPPISTQHLPTTQKKHNPEKPTLNFKMSISLTGLPRDNNIPPKPFFFLLCLWLDREGGFFRIFDGRLEGFFPKENPGRIPKNP